MKIGRNYTNCFVFEHLDEQHQRALYRGEIDLKTMKALGLEKAKKDVKLQLEITRELDHIELDGNPPNPYLEMGKEERNSIREMAESYQISLSFSLSHSPGDGGICSTSESDREAAVEFGKRCIQFAVEAGAVYVNVRPGVVPAGVAEKKLRNSIRDSLFKSLEELGRLCRDLGVAMHFENNRVFDGGYSELSECLQIVRELRERDVEVYLNFNIGNWLTWFDVMKETPSAPEKVMEKIPPDFIKELHLTDYVPGDRILRSPLHLEWGVLKRPNLERYARIVKRKNAEAVVLETELKSVEQVVNRRKLLREETEFIKSIFEV